MTTRKNTFLIKRSNVPGKVPSPGDLQLGELALNTADAILYVSGTTTNQILPIGWDRISRTGDTVTGDFNIFGDVKISGSSLPGGYALSVTGDTNFSGDVYVGGDLYYNGDLFVTGNTVIESGLTANTIYTDYIDFNTSATVTSDYGRIYWDNGTGTLNISVGDAGTGIIDLQVGQEEIVRVYNGEATTLQKGEIVYVSGSQGNRPSVKRASAVADGYSVTTFGMVDSSIASGAEGYVTTFGIISNLNTLGLTGGTPVWLSPTTPGAYTTTKPQAPYHTVLIGYVVRVSATVGSIFINISNGWELDEIHDVRISAATEGDLLVRSSYSGTPVWVNSKTLNGNYTINGNLNITGTTTTNDLNVTNNATVAGSVNSQFVSADYITSLSGDITSLIVNDLDVNGSMDIFGPLTSNSTITSNSFIGNIFSGGTFYGDGSQLIGVADIYVTGGTYNPNTETITFYQNSGGTFTVTGITRERYVTGGTVDTSGNVIFTNNLAEQFVVSGTSGYGAGVLQGSSGWTQSFNGTITLPTTNATLYDNPNFISPLKTYTITGGTSGSEFPTLVDNDTNYIFIDYNGGNPIYNISTTDTTNGSDKVRVLTVYRLGNFIHVLDFGDQGSGTSNRILNRIIATERFARESGLALGVSGTTGVVTLAGGAAWNGLNRQILDPVNSQDDIFFQNYHIGGLWTATTSSDTFNNIYYDDGTDKVSATTGSFIVNWYYRGQEINDHLYEVWGEDEYVTIDDAQASGEPPLPELVTSHAFLVGRLIIESGSFSGVSVESAFSQQFQSSQVTIHNNLSGLQGGTPGEYFHLTQNEYSNLALTNVENQFTVTQNFTNGLSANSITSTTIDASSITTNTVSGVDYIDLNINYTGSSAEGRMSWDINDGTLRVGMGGGNVNQQVGLEQYYLVSNVSGVTLTEGYVVRASGTDPINERIIGDLMIADGSIPSKFTLGIATENISSGNTGYVTSFGVVRGINATGSLFGETWSNGDILYVSPTVLGGLTNIEPQAPNLKIEVAIVLDNSATGSIFVRSTILPRIEDLTDVQTTGATTGDILVYNSSNNLWEHSTTLSASKYTINGNLLVTGSTSANTVNITSTPNTNTTENFVLVRNSSTGDIEQKNVNALITTNNTITVALTGSTGVNFNSIKSAVESITGSTSANTYTVQVAGGVYNEDPFTIPSWVSVVGESSISTILNANDSSQTLIKLSDQSAIFDCQIQGCTDTGVSAIIYSSSTTPQSAAISYVENVRFGANYTNAKVVASGGANIIMQCSNVKYGGYPFTIGFYATNDGSGIGRMQLRNVTSTNGGIVTTTGLIFAKADAASCGFIVNGCLLTKAAGAAAGTGFYVENGGFLRLTAVNFQRWNVGIDAPQIGSAPSIDAIALNFENNNTDVNIAHSGATGKIQGTDNFLKTKININAPLYEVNQDPRQITVAKKGGDFSSIKSAVDYLISSGNTSSSNRFVISVGPGEFNEGEIDLTQTPYVSIEGSNIQTTLITPTGSTQHIIKIGQNNEISFLSLSGASTGYAGIYAYDIGDFGQAHKVSMYDCDTGIYVESVTQDTIFYGEYIDINGEYSYGTQTVANNGFVSLANLENYYIFPGNSGTTGNYATGSGSSINITSSSLEGVGTSGTTAVLSRDGGDFNISATDITGWGYGYRALNVGDPSNFQFNGVTFADNIWDINVEQSTTTGVFIGISNHEKVTTISENVYWNFLDAADGELDITRKASVTFTDGSHTDFTTLLFEGSSMGLLSGGSISVVSGTTVQADSGFGYLEKSDNGGIVRRIDWINSQITLSTNTDNYIFINENSNLSSSGSRPDTFFNIVLGRVVTNSTGVEFIDLTPFNAEHTSNRFGELFTEALGPIYANGSIVTEGTTPFTLDVTAGEYYYSTNQILPLGGTGITFTQYYRNGTGSTWVTSATTLVNNTQYDNNGTLTGLTSGYYTKHTLYLVGDGSLENYFLVLGQNEYATLVETENALLPTPPTYFSDSVVQVANLYIQQGFSGITEIEDIRPTVSFRAGGVNASSVHGNLLGLANDDHTQYLLVSGSRAMSGNLNMGNNNITNVGTVNGVTVESHATRHQFGGSDPVGSVTPLANAIPYADVNGKLDSWVSTASTTTLGRVKISQTPLDVSNPIAVSTTDTGYLNSITSITYSSNTLTTTNVSGSTSNITIGLRTKAGTVVGTSFTGNPKTYDVVFTTAYPNTSYTIGITGGANRTFTYENKTTTGFRINSNANLAFTENVDWQTISIGES